MSKKTIADQEIKIKDSLFEFVKTHINDADLNLIDEIALDYVVAILEDINSDPLFDVEDFCEMMSAYFPKFKTINHTIVCQWLFELEAKLRAEESDKDKKNQSVIEIQLPEVVTKTPKSTNQRLQQHSNDDYCEPKRLLITDLTEVTDNSKIDEIDLLQEMFPHVCTIEIKNCIAIANGNIERATQILIDRQENGQSFQNTNQSLTIHVNNNKTIIDDVELKNRIIERYSYIDKESVTKEHRPVAPKVEPKKLVRYRDNKIVSLKGERFTEVKKGEDVDDISLKKNKKNHTTP